MRRSKSKIVLKFVIGISLCAIITFGSIRLTMAYFIKGSEVINQFSVGSAKISVQEQFDGSRKSDVRIRNQGNISVMVRAKVLVYWKDAEGNILLETPEESDYSIVWASESSKWEQRTEDGFWYYRSPLEAGVCTDPLIRQCEDFHGYDDGRVLVVDIVAQSIQEEK